MTLDDDEDGDAPSGAPPGKQHDQAADPRLKRAPAILDAGECGLVIEFGRTVDPLTNDRVVALDRALVSADLPGVLEIMPSYRSLMIYYDPLVISRAELVGCVTRLLSVKVERRAPRRWCFPTCYHEDFALDMASVGWTLSLSAADIVALHTTSVYRIYTHCFAPGLPAMGGLSDALRLPRLMTPRQSVPAGSVIIVDNQTSIASVDMPCGWHVIGRTPERIFVLDREPTLLTATGDEIMFEPVDIHEYRSLEQRVNAGEQIVKLVS